MRALRVFLAGVAVLGVVTGAVTVVAGSNVIPGGGEPSASIESELRFFATWWIGAGVFVAWVLRDLERRGRELRAFLALVVLAGIARALAWADAGRPDPLFVVLTVVELVLPPLVAVWHARVTRPSATLREGTVPS